MKNYINQLNSKEQYAVHCIKKLITTQLDPLIIYCFGYTISVSTRRSAFVKKQFAEERHFTCDLLIITPSAVTVDEDKRAAIQEMVAHFGTVNMVIHPLGFALRQLNEGNLFFSWVHKNGMLLHERNNSMQLLPAPVGKEYQLQAAAFYAGDPEMTGYLEVKLQRLVKPQPKQEKPSLPQPVEIRLMLDPQQGWQPAVTKAPVANQPTPED
ncbi:hypothetical protein [Niabella drilacis]|uniref:Uncharacterized protein n=1 Tax=Niabella drilacis (strain DSM 25811 / CCM 8410 / CCUG 62505 / LMG 26954 / E90) TaxID=1285928 RepID=A0A1G7AD42_NIADE|nr:hypothetical protein [Niabella drilacis]SDE11776.1 hypothetical protein SAMN04487894_12221 [Niabella drilacis]